MGIYSLARQFNRIVVDVEEEALVKAIRLFTKDESVERLARYQMDAVREFVIAHPLQSWNPLFFLVPGLGQELTDGIASNRAMFFRSLADVERFNTVQGQIEDRKRKQHDAFKKRIIAERKRQGYVTPDPDDMHRLALRLRTMAMESEAHRDEHLPLSMVTTEPFCIDGHGGSAS